MINLAPFRCPLCGGNQIGDIGKPGGRSAARCDVCELVFILPHEHLTAEAEHRRYLMHRNSRNDENYVRFLNRVSVPVVERVAAGSRILDYGSGPEPVMADLLREQGYDVALYDTFFARDQSVLVPGYDGVVCCETAEHFRVPQNDWQTMIGCLHPGDFLFVLTLLYDYEFDLWRWWYLQDPTHVSFYSAGTMRFIANANNCDIVAADDRLTIMRKK